jgi:NAD(P)-dependent dehydrogenase (short-subunit alcohol dehydrogenase family)
MARLAGKVAIVTGAGTGIGRCTAELFAREGAKVVIAEIDTPSGEETAHRIARAGGDAIFLQTDVSEPDSIAGTIASTVQHYGGLHVLHNNAGGSTSIDSTVVDAPLEEFWRAIKLDLYGTFLGCRFGIPELIRSGGGSIINVASVNGLVGAPGFAAYAGSKHAVVGMTRSVAIELGATGIRVNAICPGVFNTEMVREAADVTGIDIAGIVASKTPMKRVAGPEEVAGMMVYLASDDSSYCTGGTYAVDGGLTAGFSLM